MPRMDRSASPDQLPATFLPWPGLMSCISSSLIPREEPKTNNSCQTQNFVSERKKPKSEIKVRDKTQNKENEVTCEYCDKLFSVRTFLIQYLNLFIQWKSLFTGIYGLLVTHTSLGPKSVFRYISNIKNDNISYCIKYVLKKQSNLKRHLKLVHNIEMGTTEIYRCIPCNKVSHAKRSN